jgi:hypothetical protein
MHTFLSRCPTSTIAGYYKSNANLQLLSDPGCAEPRALKRLLNNGLPIRALIYHQFQSHARQELMLD